MIDNPLKALGFTRTTGNNVEVDQIYMVNHVCASDLVIVNTVNGNGERQLLASGFNEEGFIVNDPQDGNQSVIPLSVVSNALVFVRTSK